eukprot:Rhum_TRINITY_DN14715_c5_g1::Rhum_TRINITY_DN14715_c5_g1_i1::g.111273::m.111273
MTVRLVQKKNSCLLSKKAQFLTPSFLPNQLPIPSFLPTPHLLSLPSKVHDQKNPHIPAIPSTAAAMYIFICRFALCFAGVCVGTAVTAEWSETSNVFFYPFSLVFCTPVFADFGIVFFVIFFFFFFILSSGFSSTSIFSFSPSFFLSYFFSSICCYSLSSLCSPIQHWHVATQPLSHAAFSWCALPSRDLPILRKQRKPNTIQICQTNTQKTTTWSSHKKQNKHLNKGRRTPPPLFFCCDSATAFPLPPKGFLFFRRSTPRFLSPRRISVYFHSTSSFRSGKQTTPPTTPPPFSPPPSPPPPP